MLTGGREPGDARRDGRAATSTALAARRAGGGHGDDDRRGRPRHRLPARGGRAPDGRRPLASAGRREQALLAPCAEMARGFYFDYPGGRLDQALGPHRRRPGAAGADRGRGLARCSRPSGAASAPRSSPTPGRYHAVPGGGAGGGGAVGVGRHALARPGLLILWWRLTSLAGPGRLGRGGGPRARGAPRDRRRRRAPTSAYRITAGSRARLAAAIGDTGTALARIDAARARPPASTATRTRSRRCCASWCWRPWTCATTSWPATLAEEAVAAADRYGLDWFRARASLLSAFVHHGTPLGDRRLADALALTRRARPGGAVGRGASARGRRPCSPARSREDLPGRRPRRRPLAARAGREVLHDGVDRPRRPPGGAAPASPTRWTRRPTSTPRPCALPPGRGRPGGRRRRRARARGAGAPAAPRRSGSRRSAACASTAPGRGCPTRRSRRAKARALLGALVCAGRARRPPRPPARAPLARAAPERGARALDTTLHELRRTLEPLASAALRGLARRPRGRALPPRPGRPRLLGRRRVPGAGPRRGRRDRRASPSGGCCAAETLWRGDFLPDFPYEPWSEDTRRELERERVALLERLAAALAEMGPPGRRHRALPPAHRRRPRAGGLAPLPDARLRPGRRAGPGPAPVPRLPGHPARPPRRRASPETRELYASLL